MIIDGTSNEIDEFSERLHEYCGKVMDRMFIIAELLKDDDLKEYCSGSHLEPDIEKVFKELSGILDAIQQIHDIESDIEEKIDVVTPPTCDGGENG